ncbi:MAG: PD40 domain-containing protein [Kiritimatiellae bacterium]|nr:PD40 domain-containing protein [Kiritimatiellia bacterium]MBQ3345119.1 PD40 domain-containing protein [Kiritimatiellia bacterium]MBQ6329135.1 PD40 domain-containing protein [Kiritimatiellia bacterium]
MNNSPESVGNLAVRGCALLAALLTALVGCKEAPPAERAVTKGENPAFSPDGRRIAFQRLEGDIFKIGIVSVGGGSVEWVEAGPGNAAYPEWTPGGSLVYMAGHDSETAYEAWRGKSKVGYNLWLFDGKGKRKLTTGRCRDYTPCCSADGKKIYFVTTRGVESESAVYSKAAVSRIAEVELSPGAEPRILVDAPNGNNSGFVQPAVSPDGTTLVWGHLENFFGSWRIYGTRVGRFARSEHCPVSPAGLAALSPRWHPDGKVICFTGFRKGDPGWGVWVEELATGKVKRLATGENPVFSPDGKSIAYNRGGTVYVRPFGPGDAPVEVLPEAREDGEPEKVLWKMENVAKETSVKASGEEFAFGDDKTFFVRVKARLDGTTDLRQLLIGDCEEHEYAYQMFASYAVWFSTRDYAGRYLDVKQAKHKEGREYTFTGIRTPTRLLLSVDGCVPKVSVPRGRVLAVNRLRRFVVGRGLKSGERVVKAEVGTGWPDDVPKFKTREDLFK